MKKNRVDIITLGCSKNLVDSERLLKQFQKNGYEVYHDSDNVEGEIVVVNTCGFIGDAKEESIEMILDLTLAKKQKKIKKLYVMGCLSERYLTELVEELPEVDKFYGKFNWNELLNDLGSVYHKDLITDRVLTTPNHYAYVKIGEGCNRTCSYCAIPIITGKHQSQPMELLEEEVRGLVSKGVKEFQLIAQDLTYYGVDLYKRQALPELVERLAKIPGVEWIRLHYGYPAHFPIDLLRVMREHSNVCSYMDIALQHISDAMLKKMRRNVTKEATYALLRKMREEVPGIHIRTTLLVGHPGETEEDFEQLLEFIKDIRFERLGVFPYSDEEGTYANLNYVDDIPQEVKDKRAEIVMSVQQEIAAEINATKIGRTFKVIVDREDGDYFVGRTEFDSPEVDGEVLLLKEQNPNVQIGDFYNVKITNADVFDLYGEVILNV